MLAHFTLPRLNAPSMPYVTHTQGQCLPREADVLEGREVAEEVHGRHGQVCKTHDHYTSGPDRVQDTPTVLCLLHNENQYLLQLGKRGRGGEGNKGRGGEGKRGRGGKGRDRKGGEGRREKRELM